MGLPSTRQESCLPATNSLAYQLEASTHHGKDSVAEATSKDASVVYDRRAQALIQLPPIRESLMGEQTIDRGIRLVS